MTSPLQKKLPWPAAFARTKSFFARRGFLGAMQRALFVLRRRTFPDWEPRHPFDATHGVTTRGLLSQVDLQTGHAHDPQITAYYGTQPSTFRGGLARWQAALQQAGGRMEDFTFLDIGCGKGRVLMLASELPFRRVIGLEINPAIADVARENLVRWSEGRQRRVATRIEVVTGDVLEFALPPEPTLLYMYNPFEGELFKRWVQKLAFTLQERSEPLYLLYTYPRYEEHLALFPGAIRLWHGEVPLDRNEIATDLFGCIAEEVSLYRLTRGSNKGTAD